MPATDDLGKTISDGGSRRVLRASRTRRFILCLVTESLAAFLDTTTAYPVVSFGRVALKFGDEIRLPDLKAGAKSIRLSRFWRGNTAGFKRTGVYGRACASSARFCVRRRFLSARGIRASSLAYAFSADKFFLPYEIKELSYTHDTNRFSTESH